MKHLVLGMLFFFSSVLGASAGEMVNLTRDELAGVKKKLAAVLDAAGVPDGYARKSDDFGLPTEVNRLPDGRFSPVWGSADRLFEGATQQQGEKEMQAAGIDYQKRMAEAQARGDFMEMSRLGQAMAMMSGQMHAQILGDLRQPISLHVDFNTNASETIDPDAVVIERSGVLGLKREDGSEAAITIYFDPVALRDTSQLARAEISLPEQGVDKKNAVLNVAVTLRGPAETVEAFARSLDTKAILGVIGR